MASSGSKVEVISSPEVPEPFDDNFYLYKAKLVMCPRTDPHPYTSCPFAHPHEPAMRRDPTVCRYDSIFCFDLHNKKVCHRGPNCPYSHNVFEYFLHPSRYRTRLCDFGADCTRPLCFFAHSKNEMRPRTQIQVHSGTRRAGRRAVNGSGRPRVPFQASPSVVAGVRAGAGASPVHANLSASLAAYGFGEGGAGMVYVAAAPPGIGGGLACAPLQQAPEVTMFVPPQHGGLAVAAPTGVTDLTMAGAPLSLQLAAGIGSSPQAPAAYVQPSVFTSGPLAYSLAGSAGGLALAPQGPTGAPSMMALAGSGDGVWGTAGVAAPQPLMMQQQQQASQPVFAASQPLPTTYTMAADAGGVGAQYILVPMAAETPGSEAPLQQAQALMSGQLAAAATTTLAACAPGVSAAPSMMFFVNP